MIRGLLVLTLILVFVCAVDASAPDVYCGSRAVRFVCRHYGEKSPDLIDVIRALQWPSDGRGARLSDMSEFLAQRGIGAAAMNVDLSTVEEILQPVILHLPSHGETPAHYVVLIPQKLGPNVRIWNGLSGYGEISSRQLDRRASGNCIATSPMAPLDLSEAISFRRTTGVYLNWRRAIPIWGLLSLAALALICVRVRYLVQRRSSHGT